ncbi:L,D-transpeptidase [Peterkaempfera bronchialis]|nr:L,D-transpeptidase [Peterkaempfera bronchialis]
MTRERLRALRCAVVASALATVLTAGAGAAVAATGGHSAAGSRGSGGTAAAPAAASTPAAASSGTDRSGSTEYATSHVTTIDAATHQLRATVDGKTVAVFPVGFGQPRFRTPSGTYRVLGKDAVIEMTSCSARITCDPDSPDYYDLQVPWAVRLTSGGLFVHGAPWDHTIGSEDISHGCIHLSVADAEWFYNFSRPGDIVIVQGTGRSGGPVGP